MTATAHPDATATAPRPGAPNRWLYPLIAACLALLVGTGIGWTIRGGSTEDAEDRTQRMTCALLADEPPSVRAEHGC